VDAVHELSLTRNLVAIVAEQARGQSVRRVWLEIGTRSAIVPEAVRFCFDIAAQGTPLQGAALDIVPVEPGMQCEECGRYATKNAKVCDHCDSPRLHLRSGEELNIKAMEIQSCA
jgi:hydrogenase nickel incorporation protein HypA/HybF